ncbi:MAG: dihydrodipicolinate synthase family protein [Opitutales bacterium]
MRDLRGFLLDGQVIPAHPLALDGNRKLSEGHQRALARYYVAAGAGGIAVGVHSTQFEIRDPRHGLFEPVLAMAAETADAALEGTSREFAKIAGVCGRTPQAVREAETARGLGYHAVLVSMTSVQGDSTDDILFHCRAIGEILPIIGFYLQPSVGGRVYPYAFWRRFMEIPSLVAVKIAPFNRYQTLDVVRAAVESGRDDVALYTGNDDTIIADLLTPFCFPQEGKPAGGGENSERWIVGGLLGQWGVGTRKAVELLGEIKAERAGGRISRDWLTRAAALTDYNGALFDAANGFSGCIPGIHEVLRRQGLLPGVLCLNPQEALSPGQEEEITRVRRSYPQFDDDRFIADHLEEWLS